jgi:uncharacterized protein with gpF-like domain
MPLPKEAIKYLEKKKIKVKTRHELMWNGEHQVAFTVAEMLQAALLEDVKVSLEKALKSGQTFEAWQKSTVTKFVRDRHWVSARGSVPIKERMRVVYDTNLRTAYSHGSLERKQRNVDVLPYWQWVRGPSRVPRPEHQAYWSMVLPATDKFWQAYYPPCEYGCKCRVIPVTAARARAVGVSASPDITTTTWRSGKTTRRVPRGVHPSFAGGTERMTYALRKQAVRDRRAWAK